MTWSRSPSLGIQLAAGLRIRSSFQGSVGSNNLVGSVEVVASNVGTLDFFTRVIVEVVMVVALAAATLAAAADVDDGRSKHAHQ